MKRILLQSKTLTEKHILNIIFGLKIFMFTVNDFVLKFADYSDEELYLITQNKEGYSKEAIEAADIVINKKGGIEEISKRIEAKAVVQKEIGRIQKETKEMGIGGVDSSFIKTVTTSSILSEEEVKEIIDNKYSEVEAEIENKKIKPRTIGGSIAGGAIASVIGGTLFGLQMIFSNRIFYILVIGLALLCYGIIKFSTKQDKNNTVVLIATFLSTIASICIGYLLYSIIGYIE